MRHPHGLRAAAGAAGGPWDIGNPTYVSSFDVSAREVAPQDLYITQTRLFTIGSNGDTIDHYSISNWDITTASYVREASVAAYETIPNGLFFRSNGTRVYWVGSSSDAVYQSTLSTAWDISTAGTPTSFSVSSEETAPQGMFLDSSGTRMFIVGASSDSVHKYTLSTAWSVTSASFSQSFSVSTQDGTPNGVHFKDDGTRMFVIGAVNDSVYQYSLSTAWDLSTATYQKTFSVSAQEVGPQGVFFKDDGTFMYIIGSNSDSVHSYSL